MKPIIHIQPTCGEFEDACADLVDKGYKLFWMGFVPEETAASWFNVVFALPEALPNTDILASIEAHLEAMVL